VVARGKPEQELVELAREHDASAVYFASDVSPYAMARDRRVEDALRAAGIEPRRTAGNFVADVGKPKPFLVFTPFWRVWKDLPRRDVHGAPRRITVPDGLRVGEIPTADAEVAEPLPAGETAGRKRMNLWLRRGSYVQNDLGVETSMLSPYLHFGCVSARELESRATDPAYTRQLCWRDFYAHVMLHHPSNARTPLRDEPEWDGLDEHFEAWRDGRTGYPIVDAGMRQLKETGWMHNRARLIVACFLVKDLHVDWRRGEAHFMRLLLDGDEANNNGNWQWISSIGVDPAPVYRRLYNPELQQQRHDPDGAYVRRWVPEAGSDDYPVPIVDHQIERRRALEAYGAVRS
jgi:deoxyribodipyrimidine photo-lyase